MKISELPPGLRQLAEKHREEMGWKGPKSDQLTWAFKWRKTPEGHEYWKTINKGNFDRYYGCYPANPRPKASSVTVLIMFVCMFFSCKAPIEPQNVINDTISGTVWIHTQGEDVKTGQRLETAYWFLSDGIVYEFPYTGSVSTGTIMHRCRFTRKGRTITIAKAYNTETGVFDGQTIRFGAKDYHLIDLNP